MSDMDRTSATCWCRAPASARSWSRLRYGREAELESDLYGMRYMKRAGYDPSAAVTLQEKFVKLAEKQGGGQAAGSKGLFASHPPSAERVARNRQRASPSSAIRAAISARALRGAHRAAAQACSPPTTRPTRRWRWRARRTLPARRRWPPRRREAGAERVALPQLQGDLALAQKKPKEALPFYESGRSSSTTTTSPPGSAAGTATALPSSAPATEGRAAASAAPKLLPTAPALYYLGNIAKESGNRRARDGALKGAAGSKSELGKRAAAEYATIDVGRNPGNYVASGAQLDGWSASPAPRFATSARRPSIRA
jgi:beta-barrel assembly-enhancing protease